DEDLADPDRARRTFVRYLSRAAMLRLIAALGIGAAVGFVALPARTWPYPVALLCASVLYSHPRFAWKRIPGASSALHALSGALHFLVGATLVRPLDGRALLLAAWCG